MKKYHSQSEPKNAVVGESFVIFFSLATAFYFGGQMVKLPETNCMKLLSDLVRKRGDAEIKETYYLHDGLYAQLSAGGEMFSVIIKPRGGEQ